MLDGLDLERAREALHSLDPGCSREDWHRIGRAAIAAGLTVDDIDRWSSGADNYAGEKDVRAAFRTIKPEGGTGPGSLFYMASAAGWKGTTERTAHGRPGKAPARPVARPKGTPPGKGAADVWARCTPATDAHPYIVAKQGAAAGLRVVPEGDTLRIAGAGVAGWLAVPVLAGDALVSLQFIPPPGAGKKLNLPGAPMAGTFTVGELVQGGTAYLCEGIGQAWACWKATGNAAVVCFGWGRVRAVAGEMRQRDAAARLVLVPDVGKEPEAERIARELGALFVMLPDSWPANADVNDLAQRDGFDALEALLAGVSGPATRYKLMSSAELHAMPPMVWRVRGVLPAQGLASIYGPSASGKSFLVLDMAAAIAEGRDWFGYRVTAAAVVYVCLEGAAGFRLRVEAWEKINGRPLPADLRVVIQPFRLTEPQDVQDMAAAVLSAGGGAVTFIDTLNAAAPGTDENASKDMGIVLEASKTLQAATGGLVAAVHHAGKDITRGLRGHSSLFAAMDAVIAVSRDAGRRSWTTDATQGGKAKDAADSPAHAFRLEVVELGLDDDGEPASSCVIRPDDTPENATRSKLPKGGNQKVVLDALGDLLRKSHTFGRADAPAQRPCVEVEAAVDAIAPRLVCEPPRRKERTRLALTGLVAAGVVKCHEGWLWLP